MNILNQLMLSVSIPLSIGVMVVFFLYYYNVYSNLSQWEEYSTIWLTQNQKQILHNFVIVNKMLSQMHLQKISNDLITYQGLLNKFQSKQIKILDENKTYRNCSYRYLAFGLCDENIYDAFKDNKETTLDIELFSHRTNFTFNSFSQQDQTRLRNNWDFYFLAKSIFVQRQNDLISVSLVYNTYSDSLLTAIPSSRTNLSSADYQTCQGDSYIEPYDPRCRGWYINAMKSPGNKFYKPYQDLFTNTTVMTCSSRIDEKNGDNISVMSVDFVVKNLINKQFLRQDQDSLTQNIKQHSVLFHEENNTVYYHQNWDSAERTLKSYEDLEFNYTNGFFYEEEKIDFIKQLESSKLYAFNGNYNIYSNNNTDPFFSHWKKNKKPYMSLIYPIVITSPHNVWNKKWEDQQVLMIGMVREDKTSIFSVLNLSKDIKYAVIITVQTSVVILIIFVLNLHYRAILKYQIEIPISQLTHFLLQNSDQSRQQIKNEERFKRELLNQFTSNLQNSQYVGGPGKAIGKKKSSIFNVPIPQNSQMPTQEKLILKNKNNTPNSNNIFYELTFNTPFESFNKNQSINSNINNNNNNNQKIFAFAKQQSLRFKAINNNIQKDLAQNKDPIDALFFNRDKCETSYFQNNKSIQKDQQSSIYDGINNINDISSINLKDNNNINAKINNTIINNQNNFSINNMINNNSFNNNYYSNNSNNNSNMNDSIIEQSQNLDSLDKSVSLKESIMKLSLSSTSIIRSKRLTLQATQVNEKINIEQDIEPKFHEMQVIKDTFHQLADVIAFKKNDQKLNNNNNNQNNHGNNNDNDEDLDISQCILHYSFAAKIFKQIKNTFGLSISFLNLGFFSQKKSDYIQSIIYYESALNQVMIDLGYQNLSLFYDDFLLGNVKYFTQNILQSNELITILCISLFLQAHAIKQVIFDRRDLYHNKEIKAYFLSNQNLRNLWINKTQQYIEIGKSFLEQIQKTGKEIIKKHTLLLIESEYIEMKMEQEIDKKLEQHLNNLNNQIYSIKNNIVIKSQMELSMLTPKIENTQTPMQKPISKSNNENDSQQDLQDQIQIIYTLLQGRIDYLKGIFAQKKKNYIESIQYLNKCLEENEYLEVSIQKKALESIGIIFMENNIRIRELMYDEQLYLNKKLIKKVYDIAIVIEANIGLQPNKMHQVKQSLLLMYEKFITKNDRTTFIVYQNQSVRIIQPLLCIDKIKQWKFCVDSIAGICKQLNENDNINGDCSSDCDQYDYGSGEQFNYRSRIYNNFEKSPINKINNSILQSCEITHSINQNIIKQNFIQLQQKSMRTQQKKKQLRQTLFMIFTDDNNKESNNIKLSQLNLDNLIDNLQQQFSSSPQIIHISLNNLSNNQSNNNNNLKIDSEIILKQIQQDYDYIQMSELQQMNIYFNFHKRQDNSMHFLPNLILTQSSL